jgi:hypothetical protein
MSSLSDARKSPFKKLTANDERFALADFLASSGDNEEVLRHVAGVALHLDRARDAALVAEHDASPENLTVLQGEITDCNGYFTALEEELRSRLEVDRTQRLRRPGNPGNPGASQRPAVA